MSIETTEMALKNSKDGYGLVARLLHWLMAIAILGLFGLGFWMVDLTYYSPYYKTAPDLHISIGMTLLVALIGRIVWRQINPRPDDSYLPTHERIISHLVHMALYALLIILMISGYLIFTADGRPLIIFGLFEVPSLYQATGLEDQAGFIHKYTAYGLIGLSTIHALAALKHHFIDKDPTLLRMLRD
ncbi:MAG: cytochrome b [Cohaesibacter sp.]|jgi:cytochrome b561|nr:cytochrome b [Cohaesibacter sp.]